MAGYVLGNLDPAEVEELQQLLALHPQLTQEIDQLQETLAQVPHSLPSQEPSDRLLTKILHSVPASASARGLFAADPLPIAPPQPTRLRRRAIPIALGSIAAVAVLALGVENNRLQQQLREQKFENIQLQQQAQADLDQLRQQLRQVEPVVAALQQPGAVIYSLEGTGPARTASGTLVMTSNQQMLAVTHNLPPLPGGRVYRVWGVANPAATPAFCGEFNSSPTGLVQWSPPVEICRSVPIRVLITINPVTDPPLPGGDLVMHSRGR